MIRVAFILRSTGENWIGGLNYFHALLHCISDSVEVHPIILVGPKGLLEIRGQFPSIETLVTNLVEPKSALRWFRKLIELILRRDVLMERFLRANLINILSHSGDLGPRSKFVTIGWIPDLQHLKMPQYFQPRELRSRTRRLRRTLKYCSKIVVSSDVARGHLLEVAPSANQKIEVLRFVGGSRLEWPPKESRAELARRYNIPSRFFYLPNQFWMHKNHLVVIEALKRLRARGHRLAVVATGNTTDYRNPLYFSAFLSALIESGCGEDFKILGVVQPSDVASLLWYSMAVINPSYFEGWSTTVEESKSIGKTVILSKIPVHEEQAPADGVYFDPNDAGDLARKMLQVSCEYSVDDDAKKMSLSRKNLDSRMRLFGTRFEEILLGSVDSCRQVHRSSALGT